MQRQKKKFVSIRSTLLNALLIHRAVPSCPSVCHFLAASSYLLWIVVISHIDRHGMVFRLEGIRSRPFWVILFGMISARKIIVLIGNGLTGTCILFLFLEGNKCGTFAYIHGNLVKFLKVTIVLPQNMTRRIVVGSVARGNGHGTVPVLAAYPVVPGITNTETIASRGQIWKLSGYNRVGSLDRLVGLPIQLGIGLHMQQIP